MESLSKEYNKIRIETNQEDRMQIIENLVLGAGIAGLAYANEKKKTGEPVEIFEATDHMGGLCHSFLLMYLQGKY